MERRERKTIEVRFTPTVGTQKDLAKAAILSAVPDHSPESRAIFSSALALTNQISLPKDSNLIAPENEDSFSGIDFKGSRIRKGRLDRIESWLKQSGERHARGSASHRG